MISKDSQNNKPKKYTKYNFMDEENKIDYDNTTNQNCNYQYQKQELINKNSFNNDENSQTEKMIVENINSNKIWDENYVTNFDENKNTDLTNEHKPRFDLNALKNISFNKNAKPYVKRSQENKTADEIKSEVKSNN